MGKRKPLPESHPDIAREWDARLNASDPSSVSHGSDVKAWWRCPEGHSYQARVNKRVIGQGCPYCAGVKALAGFNDLASVIPTVAAEWHPSKNDVDPEGVTAGSGKKYWWLCAEGHEYAAAVNHRTGGTGCPYCANREVLLGWNDLASQHPKVAAEWCEESNRNEPTEVLATAVAAAWWRCRLGHRWEVSVRSRTLHQSGCPYCSGLLAITGVSDLATTYPDVASEWHPTKNTKVAAEVLPKSHKKAWWVCAERHEYQARIGSRTNGSGCPQCSGNAVIPGVNDLATVNPVLAREWSKSNDRTPADVKSMSDYRAYWKCVKGHEWRAAVGSRHHVGVGCPSCAQYGFSPARAALLYLLTNETLQAFKVGITNYGTTRIAQFVEMGWHETYLIYNRSGGIIKAAETELLRWLRVDLGLNQALTREQMPIGGATETFPLGAVAESQITERMLLSVAAAEQSA